MPDVLKYGDVVAVGVHAPDALQLGGGVLVQLGLVEIQILEVGLLLGNLVKGAALKALLRQEEPGAKME